MGPKKSDIALLTEQITLLVKEAQGLRTKPAESAVDLLEQYTVEKVGKIPSPLSFSHLQVALEPALWPLTLDRCSAKREDIRKENGLPGQWTEAWRFCLEEFFIAPLGGEYGARGVHELTVLLRELVGIFYSVCAGYFNSPINRGVSGLVLDVGPAITTGQGLVLKMLIRRMELRGDGRAATELRRGNELRLENFPPSLSAVVAKLSIRGGDRHLGEPRRPQKRGRIPEEEWKNLSEEQRKQITQDRRNRRI